jgi:pimeloyl-ACP methyl ester carboxylesterase
VTPCDFDASDEATAEERPQAACVAGERNERRVTPWSHEMGPPAAPLVALVHGAMDRSAAMVLLSRRLDTDFRVLRYDRRGYARSYGLVGPFTMDAHVADLVALLDGRRAIVFGHSYGGNVALALAERHPELVRGVAVYEVPLSWLPWWPGGSGRRGTALEGSPEDAAERFMRRMVGDERWEALPETTRAARREEGVAFVAEVADAAAAPPWRAEHIDVPFVAMYGSLTREHHRDGCHFLAELLSDRPAIAIEGARHNGPFTHPEAVAAVLRDLHARAPG